MARRQRRAKTRSIAVFDLDGTLVREQLIILLFREFGRLGVFGPRTMEAFDEMFNDHRYRRITFHEFDEGLVALFNRSIVGRTKDEMRSAATMIARRHKDWLYTFSRELLATLRETHECITITGAVHEVVEEMARFWGFEHWYASRLELIDGEYTGNAISLPVHDKKRALDGHVRDRKGKASTRGSVAIGDTTSDLPMLETVEHPIAFNPSAELADLAERRGWPIVTERKSNVYVMWNGGYRRFCMDDVAAAVRHVLEDCRGT